MDRKLKKDFRERHKANLEREMLKAETSAIPEESKLKHNDDYRGKILHDKERFQDKVHEKIRKVSSDNERVQGTSKRNEKYRASDKESVNFLNETGKAYYDTEIKNRKIYDPLGQDLDNDGIIDRYDNDFRDSDYFESTYDVDDNLQNKEKSLENSSKNHKYQKNKYKRKTIPKASIQEKRTMYQKKINLKVKRQGKIL